VGQGWSLFALAAPNDQPTLDPLGRTGRTRRTASGLRLAADE